MQITFSNKSNMDKKSAIEKMQIIKKYAEMLNEIKNSGTMRSSFRSFREYGYGDWRPRDYQSTAKKCFLVESLPDGTLSIYDKQPETFQSNSNGVTCKKCNISNEYANTNQPDGSFICYGCRLEY